MYIFLASGGGSPLYPGILQYNTMTPQRIRIIAVDAGFEPGTSAPEVWRATNEPPHLLNLGTWDEILRCYFYYEIPRAWPMNILYGQI